jgi:transposase
MGRMLDTLHAAGVTEVFLEVAREARRAFPFPVRALHADATSFHVHGQYEGLGEEVGAIRVTYDYSRDHRPDLKQWVMNLVCADTGGIPLLFAPGDGNQKEARAREVDVEEEGLRRRVARAEGEAPLSVIYRLLARLEVDEGKLERARRGLGRFLLATDVLDREALPAGEVLGRYKDQTRTVERGFRFLKDPLFFTGSTFLKRPERVMALGMVMALALLVYALAKDPPCAGCSSSSSGCAWWSWRVGPWC